MANVQAVCALCGKLFMKKRIEMHMNNFCCRDHFYRWNSERISDYNRSKNPMNMPGGVLISRVRRSNMLRGRGQGKSYRKLLGRHEHRVVAESILKRPLRKDEVVHHIDGNKQNNAVDNLMVFASQAEHVKYHSTSKRGDAK